MNILKPGDEAPDFTLPDARGAEVTLSRFKGEKPVVLFFYPRDGTLICTREACRFRDDYESFREGDAEVIGVSADTKESHASFASRHGLPFLLLSDREGEVRKKYRVPATLGLLPGRVTFVIDKEGIIRHVFSSQFSAARHVEEALRALRSLER